MNDEILKELKEINKNLERDSRENKMITIATISIAVLATVATLGQFVLQMVEAKELRTQILGGFFGLIIIAILLAFVWLGRKLSKQD